MGRINLFKSVLCSTLIVVFLSGCGKKTVEYVSMEPMQEMETQTELHVEETQTAESEVEVQPKLIYVYVCGEVNSPGVYTLPEGSRIIDVFQMADGFTQHAATDYWNQASLLKDGEMIYVPTIEQASERTWEGMQEETSSQEDSAAGKVNINTASKELLMTIPGIGEAKANAIISYRESNGSFSSIEDVKNVEGIKDGVYAKMKEYIVIN